MSFDLNSLSSEITQSMIAKKIWQPSCPVKLEQLTLVRLEHYDFAGNIKQGQLIVNSTLADNTIAIFKELLAIKFPIAKMRLIDEYGGDDNLSMQDNNSSCFNYRTIANSNVLSMHSYGLAIDINPVQNPYIIINENTNAVEVLPAAGIAFLNRHNQRAGMVEPIVGIFKKYGFDVWGGLWNEPIDYQHFQVERTHTGDFV